MQEPELLDLKETIRAGFEGIHTRLDLLNGRVRQNEVNTAVLQDRSDRTERAAEGAKTTAGTIGAVSGGVVSGLIEVIKALVMR